MFKFVLGILLLVVFSVVAPVAIFKSMYLQEERPKLRKPLAIASIVLGVVLCVVLVWFSFLVNVAPGQNARVHAIDGSTRELGEGYQQVAPWNKIYSWSMRPVTMTFTESDDPTDAFGAQTSDKDYLQAIASISVAIDSERLGAYSAQYGDTKIEDTLIAAQIKKELKRAFDTVVGAQTTDYVMKNKSAVCAQARELAFEYMQEYPFKMVQITFEDIAASDEYEQAIRNQALLRMQSDAAELQKKTNEQEALANKAKAEGEAEVRRVEAEAAAAVKKIEAENAAAVKVIEANNASETAKIKANADAEVVTINANAEASATVLKGEAEAKSATALGVAYKNNPALIEIKMIEAFEKLSTRWNGAIPVSFGGTGVLNFANVTDIIKTLFNNTAVVETAQ